MKYLDILLKAATIALFITNISNTTSIIGFALYCLFQQSGVTFFSYGTPKNMMHRARDTYETDQHIIKTYQGKYTIANITKAVLNQISEFKSDYAFFSYLKLYRNHLAYAGIRYSEEITHGDKVKLDNKLEALAYLALFSHKKILHIPKKYIDVIKRSQSKPKENNIDTNDNSSSIMIGYPRHLQLVIIHTLESKTISQIDIMLQIGNQYKFKAKMATQTARYYGLAILSVFGTMLTPLALIPSTVLFYIAMKKYQPSDFFTLNIGFDPNSPASSLSMANPNTGEIQYSLGAILMNVIINILLFSSFSLFGAINIFNLIPVYSVTALTIFTLYDRFLVAQELSPLWTKPTKKVYVQPYESENSSYISVSKYGDIPVYEPIPPGFNIPSPISRCIRICHYYTAKLTHSI